MSERDSGYWERAVSRPDGLPPSPPPRPRRCDCERGLRERLARDIQQVPHTRAWVPDAEGEARNRGLDEALAVVRGVGELGDEPHIESCPVCGGITEHVVGCEKMDAVH